jgi:hypothetical protein
MPSFDAAHVNQQGVDLIIVPVNNLFASQPAAEQSDLIDQMEHVAHSAGLKGTVVPVWPVGRRMAFIAPQPWHPFFSSLTYNDVLANVNQKISW